MARQGKQMRICAREEVFAYHSVKLVLLANGDRLWGRYQYVFLWVILSMDCLVPTVNTDIFWHTFRMNESTKYHINSNLSWWFCWTVFCVFVCTTGPQARPGKKQLLESLRASSALASNGYVLKQLGASPSTAGLSVDLDRIEVDPKPESNCNIRTNGCN
jgi:hypothetical protein